MLWLCLHFPRLPLESLHYTQARPAAVLAKQRRDVLLCLNEAAEEAGLEPGMPPSAAQALCPDVVLLPRDTAGERDALKAAAAWATQFGDPVHLDHERALVWVEIGNSRRLFGGFAPLQAQVQAALEELELSADDGIAPTLEAAAILAVHRRGCSIETLPEMRAALAGLPLTVLHLAPEALELLRQAGLRKLADVQALPRDAIARRLGSDPLDYLDRLLGRAADPHARFKPAAIYRRRFDFHDEIETVEGLSFVLRRLLHEFEGYLRGRDAAVQTLHLDLTHADKGTTTVTQNLLGTRQDARALEALLHARFERLNLPAPVVSLTLRADRFLPAQKRQLDLFDGSAQLQEALEDVIERLGARLGDKSVVRLAAQARHIPESAWQQAAKPEMPETKFPPRPLWLLPAPQAIARPELLGAPERIESGGWDDEAVQRDYYVATQADQRRLWVYRDAQQGRWYLHGLWL